MDVRTWWERDLDRAASSVSATALRWIVVVFGIVLLANAVRLGLADTGVQALLAVAGLSLSAVVLGLSLAIRRRQVATGVGATPRSG